MLVNRENIANAFTGFRAAFNKGFSGVQLSSDKVAMTVPSNSASETLGWLQQLPRMREWIGDRVINSLASQGWTIKNRSFESTIGVNRDDFEDDKYGVFSPLFEQMGKSAAEYPDELIFKLLKDGWTTQCYDGQYFFDIEHPVGTNNGTTDEISVANTDGGSGSPWFLLDTSQVIKPLIFQDRRKARLITKDNEEDENVFMRKEYLYGVDIRFNVSYGLWQLAWGSKQTLNAANYNVARTGLASMVGDQNRPLGVRPTLLVCGIGLEGAARKILFGDLNDSGGSNEWKGTADLLVSPWL
jgi:phage major head subunit gpT-like protein